MFCIVTNRGETKKGFDSTVRLNGEVQWVIPGRGSAFQNVMPHEAHRRITAALASESRRTAAGAVLLLFIHGFNNSFVKAATRARQLDESLRQQPDVFRGVTVAFSWPSAGEITTYWGDRSKARYVAQGILRVLDQLEMIVAELAGRAPVRLVVMAHSMGNFVLSAALGARAALHLPAGGPRPLDQALLVAADVDAESLLPGWPGNGILACSRRVTAYFSPHDSALIASVKLAHNPKRLGQVGPASIETLGQAAPAADRARYLEDVVAVDCSTFAHGPADNLDGRGGHSAYFREGELLADLSSTLMLTGDRTIIPGRVASVAGSRTRFHLDGQPGGMSAPGVGADEPAAEGSAIA